MRTSGREAGIVIERICRADRGRAAAFTCTYHAWTYANDGSLVGVPRFREDYFGELNKDEWGLIRVPRLESYKGLLFGSFDADAPPLRDYLGAMAWYLDTVLDRRSGGTELIGGVHKWTMAANWKIAMDNHVGDLYHAPYTHASRQLALNRRPSYGNAAVTFQVNPGPGHGLGVTLLRDTDEMIRNLPEFGENVIDYYRDTMAETADRLGSARSRIRFLHGGVFPNFGMVPGMHTIRVVHPRGTGADRNLVVLHRRQGRAASRQGLDQSDLPVPRRTQRHRRAGRR